MAIALGSVGVLSLTAWGLLRGYQLRFVAGLAGNPLGQFLETHPLLAAVFYIFITLATPIIGAAALLFGWQELSRARTWRKVRTRFETLRTAEIKLARDIQTEQEHLENFDKRKQAQCLEWRAIFAQFYNRGRRNGACRETRWSVLRKSLLGGLVALPVAIFFPFPWFLVAPAIPVLGLFIYFNHRRHHPSHERYLALENTHFAVTPDAPQPPELRAPTQRLLSKGDQQ
jgi:hypothetical protein